MRARGAVAGAWPFLGRARSGRERAAPTGQSFAKKPRTHARRRLPATRARTDSRFSAGDQIKTRAGTSLGTSTFSGTSWQGDLGQLTPGIGYEIKVSQAMTFNYGDSSDHSL